MKLENVFKENERKASWWGTKQKSALELVL